MTATATLPATQIDWEAVARAGMHPIALDILELATLDDGNGWSPKQFADVLGKPLGVVSYHVRQLAARELLNLVRTEPVRGALAHFYSLAEVAVA